MPAKGTTRLPRVDCVCKECGKFFTVKGSQAAKGNGRFCSVVCKVASQTRKVLRVCETCHETFAVSPSRIHYDAVRFCSMHCTRIHQAANRKLDRPPRHNGTRYVALREKVLARDGHRCVYCGSAEQLQIHHVESWTSRPDLRFEEGNCLTVCLACHRTVNHRGAPLAFKQASLL